MDLIVLGTSHQTAPAEIRDEVQFNAADLEAFCGAAPGQSVGYPGALGPVHLQPDRGLLAGPGPSAGAGHAPARGGGAEGCTAPEQRSLHVPAEGEGAVRHLFRVASGIESLMVGEPQILGQVRDAHKLADLHRTSGAVLTRLFDSALHVGKRARHGDGDRQGHRLGGVRGGGDGAEGVRWAGDAHGGGGGRRGDGRAGGPSHGGEAPGAAGDPESHGGAGGPAGGGGGR
jgi:hypothetical protein